MVHRVVFVADFAGAVFRGIVFALAGIALTVWAVKKWTARKASVSAAKPRHVAKSVRKASSIS